MNIRIDKIDLVKTIGILAVVLGHIGNPYSKYIYSWHMPLFFFIAGYLLKDNYRNCFSVIANYAKKYFRIFVLANIAGILLASLRNYFLAREMLTWQEIVVDTFLYANSAPIVHYGFVLWFLPALFWAKSFFIWGTNSRHSWVAYILLLFIASLHKFEFHNYLGIRAGLDASLYVFLGYLYKQVENNILLVRGLSIIALVVILNLSIPDTNIQMGLYDNKIISIVYALLNIVIIFNLVDIIDRSLRGRFPILSYLGKHSLQIMILHVYTNNIAHIIVEKILKQNYWQVKLLISVLLSVLLLEGYYFIKGRIKYKAGII